VFHVPAFLLSLKEFEAFLQGSSPSERYAQATVAQMQNQRTFFLYKGAPAQRDSRFPTGLRAIIKLSPRSINTKVGQQIKLRAVVTNTSNSIWLPRSAGVGAVQLGCHVYESNGALFRNRYHWEVLTPGDGRPIIPDETIEFDVNLPPLPRGSFFLEFDMVSNEVCWFASNGSPTVQVSLEVM